MIIEVPEKCAKYLLSPLLFQFSEHLFINYNAAIHVMQTLHTLYTVSEGFRTGKFKETLRIMKNEHTTLSKGAA